MLVVSDTSPLSALAKLDWLEWLRLRWERVAIPAAVWTELQQMDDAEALGRLAAAMAAGWLATRAVIDTSAVLRLREFLDAGESEAIVLAGELHADAVMIDELDGRNAARNSGLAVTGTVGLLVWAKREGLIPSAAEAMRQLESRARFFLSNPVRETVLRLAGESP